jgi:hypothetical protein
MDMVVTFVLGLLRQVVLPDWLVLVIALVVSGVAFYIGVLKGKWIPTPFYSIVTSMQKEFVSYDQIGPRIEATLKRFKLTSEFAGWLSKNLTSVILSVPALGDAPQQQIVDVTAKMFTSLPDAKRKDLVPALQGQTPAFVIDRIISVILMLPSVWDLIRKLIAAAKDGDPA